MVSDRDPRFTSELWEALWKGMGTKLKMTTAHRPQADGKSERSNRTVQTMLRAFINDMGSDWDRPHVLALLELGLNNSVVRTTGQTPFVTVQGYAPTIPATWLVPGQVAGQVDPSAPTEERTADLRRLWGRIRDKVHEAQERQQDDADSKRVPNDVQLQEGDLVLLHTAKYPALRRSKLHDILVGPYKVEEVLSPSTVRLTLPANIKINPVINIESLKKYVTPVPEDPEQPVEPGPVGKTKRGEDLWEIDRILQKRVSRGQKQYMVRWKGYGPQHDSWEPITEMRKFPDLIEQFEAQQPIARRSPRRPGG